MAEALVAAVASGPVARRVPLLDLIREALEQARELGAKEERARTVRVVPGPRRGLILRDEGGDDGEK